MVFCNFCYIETNKTDIAVTILILIDGFLQCLKRLLTVDIDICHNPYFNRWFSAIGIFGFEKQLKEMSQSLF